MFGSIEKIARFGIAAFALVAVFAVSGAPEAGAQSAAPKAQPAVVQMNGSGYGGHYGGRMTGHNGSMMGQGDMMMGQGGHMMAQGGQMMGHDGSMAGRSMGRMGGRNCGW